MSAARRDIQALMGGPIPDIRPASELRSTYRLIPDAELGTMPKPEQAIDGLYPASGFVVIYGPPGAGKTFLALDLAFHHGTGRPWQGRDVRRGPVVYVVAEGSSGVGARVRAWKEQHAAEGPCDVFFVTVPVPLMDTTQAALLVADIAEQAPGPPVAIVIDTLARCMIGGDENSTRDMSQFVAGVDLLRQETGAAVIVIHHTSKAGGLERGNSSLRGAADTMMALKPKDDAYLLTCEKQKDAPPFSPILLALDPVGESCVITATEGLAVNADAMTPNEREAANVLRDSFMADGATVAQWLAASDMPERTFYRARKSLYDKGFVACPNVGARGARYTLTDKAETLFTATLPLTAKSLPGSDSDHCQPQGGSLDPLDVAVTEGFSCPAGCGREVGSAGVVCVQCRKAAA